jgi:nicotinamide-nucleotide amidase
LNCSTLVERIAGILRTRRLTLVTAESCTGGWIAKLLTDIAGSSDWFERGFVTYSNAAKQESLHVPAETLQRHGAVSEQTVMAMADGALRLSRAQVALAVSGIAGPGGGSLAKPVGTVWLAWGLATGNDSLLCTRHYQFQGDRDAVREQAVCTALEGLLDVLERH